MVKEEVEIKSYINGKLVKLKMKRKVVKVGNGGGVLVPKELVGKEVKVEYEEK